LTHTIGFPFIELRSVDSTNNYATALAHEGMARHGTAVFAHRQTKGRGQRSKEWVTGEGNNIALSLVLEPSSLPTSRLFSLSMAVAIGVHDFFRSHAGEGTAIKWPNDIYWRDRKAAGILIENQIQGGAWKFAVAGTGINVNQTDFGELQQRAVSLKQITGKDYDPVELAKDLCAFIDSSYQLLHGSPEKLVEEYHSRLYKLNEAVRFKKESRVFQGIVRGVTPNGQLIVRHALEELFEVGEVEWLAG
jgi:BirA family biotin operon repressor/biotin-[acetyl-CoA-carboxylase] ligase